MSVPVLNPTRQREAVRLLKLTLGVIDMESDSPADMIQALCDDVEKPLRYLLKGIEIGASQTTDPVRVPDAKAFAPFDRLNSREDVTSVVPQGFGQFTIEDKLGTKFTGTYDQCIAFLDAGLEADRELARPTFERPTPDAKPNRLSYLGSGKIVTSHGTLDVDALIGVLLSTVAIYK